MRIILSLLFTILLLKLQAQECSYIETKSGKWLTHHDQFSFLGKEMTHLLNQINLIGYKRDN